MFGEKGPNVGTIESAPVAGHEVATEAFGCRSFHGGEHYCVGRSEAQGLGNLAGANDGLGVQAYLSAPMSTILV